MFAFFLIIIGCFIYAFAVTGAKYICFKAFLWVVNAMSESKKARKEKSDCKSRAKRVYNRDSNGRFKKKDE